MAKTINKIFALALMLLLCMTAVAALESNDDEKDTNGEDPDNDDYLDEKEGLLGDGEFSVNITVLNDKNGETVPGASVYGFNEGKADGDWREFQEVKGITDENGSITFHLDIGTFQFWAAKDKYFENFFVLEIKGAVNYTINITPFPPESSIVKGSVKDEKTGEVLSDVELSFNLIESPLLPKEQRPPEVPMDDDEEWEDKEGSSENSGSSSSGYMNYYYIPMKFTHTDPKGYYTVKLIPGTYYVDAHLFWKDAYLEDEREGPEDSSGSGGGVEKGAAEYLPYSTKIVVVENETVWHNISLEPLPPVDAMIKGYARDEDGNGVGDAWIYVFPSFVGANGEVPEGKPVEDDKDDTRDDEKEMASGGGAVGSVDTPPNNYPGYGNEYFGYTEKDGYYEIPLRAGDYIMTVSPPYYYGGDDVVEYDEKPMPGNDEGGGSKEANRGDEVEEIEIGEEGTSEAGDTEPWPDEGNFREHSRGRGGFRKTRKGDNTFPG